MKAALLSVGTELLLGEITNTNTVYLSQRLNALGIDVMYHYTVGDNPKRMAEMIEFSFSDCDLVITTGGLGPTQDDMTKEIICQVLDDELVRDETVLHEIEERMRAFNRPMPENNLKMADVPSRAVIFHNDAGTAPGFALADKEGRKWIACMPGVPREMTRMFEKSVEPWLAGMSNECLFYKELRLYGIGESGLEMKLLPLIEEQTNPTIATYAKTDHCSVRIAAKAASQQEAEKLVDEMIAKVDKLVGEYIYSYDDEDLVDVVGRKLIEKGLTIAAAESCTAGMFTAALGGVSGISACLDRGIVTYSNRAKMEELGVRAETLDEFGAVSEETAMEMAEGIRRVSGTDIGVSVTGVAGPGGGTAAKPVGLVYVGFVYGDKKLCRKIDRRVTDRYRNRHNAMLSMLDIINRNI